jgi:nucleotide-binding universal stress UspA family protein
MHSQTEFRRILVTTDFSAGSADALNVACALAEKTGGAVTILHVLDETRALTSDHYRKQLAETSEHELQQLAQQVTGRRCAVGTKIGAGTPYHVILKVIEEDNMDIVVMNTHGKGMVERVLMGSTTENVVREARCPVLLIRSKSPADDAAGTKKVTGD